MLEHELQELQKLTIKQSEINQQMKFHLDEAWRMSHQLDELRQQALQLIGSGEVEIGFKLTQNVPTVTSAKRKK